jgi:pimeloyl-ACP methyl ester carboxylesterase
VERRPARRGFAIARSDGSPLYYELFEAVTPARPGATPVVLSDGIGCDGYVWRYVLDDLADHRVIRWHYRGHGRTPAPRDPARLGIADLADDLADVLDELDVPTAVLGGHSMGVQVSLETYRRHGRRVAGLVLVCGAASHPAQVVGGLSTHDEVLPRLQRLVARAPGVFNRLTRAVLPTRLAYEVAARLEIRRDLVEPADFMPYLEGMARVDTRLFVGMLGEAARHSAEALLPSVEVPTLVLSGERDGFTPPDRSRQMARAIPGARLVEIPGGSHTAPLERPELVRAALRDYLDRLATPAGASD